MQPRVFDALKTHVLNSEATVMYFSLCKDVIDSFVDKSLKIEERIFKIWSAIFFLRVWRDWIKRNDYKTADHFITESAYVSIELNGHGLINLLAKLNKPELFEPSLFSSQICEETFRKLRSMSTMEWTRVNCNMIDMLKLFKRIELLNYIIHVKLPACGIRFPRIEKKLAITKNIESLPTNEKIGEILEKARNHAIEKALCFDVDSVELDSFSCKVNVLHNLSNKKSNIQLQVNEDEPLLLYNEEDRLPFPDERHNKQCNAVEQMNVSQRISETSIFTTIHDQFGNDKVIRKSSLLWELSLGKSKISNDRLRRVQGCTIEKMSKMKTLYGDGDNEDNYNLPLYRAKVIEVGEWCIFFEDNKNNMLKSYRSADNINLKKKIGLHKEKNSDENITFQNIIVGQLLSFQYIDGQTKKDRQYIRDSVQIDSEPRNREIQALAAWHKLDESGKLFQPSSKRNCFYINADKYLATLNDKPTKENADLTLNTEAMTK